MSTREWVPPQLPGMPTEFTGASLCWHGWLNLIGCEVAISLKSCSSKPQLLITLLVFLTWCPCPRPSLFSFTPTFCRPTIGCLASISSVCSITPTRNNKVFPLRKFEGALDVASQELRAKAIQIIYFRRKLFCLPDFLRIVSRLLSLYLLRLYGNGHMHLLISSFVRRVSRFVLINVFIVHLFSLLFYF